METELVTIDIKPLLEPEKAKANATPQPATLISRTADLLSSPKTILGISAVFMTGYVTFIAREGGFSSQFLHFGPGTDASNTTTFIGIVLDTWPKVCLMYFVSFLSAVMNTYYTYAMTNNLHSYIWNRAVPKVPFSRRWTYVVTLAEPFIMQVLTVTTFFTNLTMQLQFIVPQFIGGMIIEVPFTIQRLREKEYEFP
jgi:hypothetical protein